ncbi:hypothetical protein [Nesterenkonia ebinurensis]|uniref:hypothetical protein n=1 Tax=Nesterenkonia ebinurensis TaxID=2608252 RepID=UPI00168B5334|nr:hypothetical protein [Nesterenkonia ebinurensis]
MTFTTVHPATRSLTALLGVGALTFTLAACGDDDDRTPGQLGQEPETHDEEVDAPADDPEGDDDEEPEDQDDPLDQEDDDGALDDDSEDPFDNDNSSYTGDFAACDLLSEDELDGILGGGYDIEIEELDYSQTRDQCEWEWEHPDDMWDFGFLSISLTGPDDRVSNADVYEGILETEESLGEVQELAGIGDAAFYRTDGYSMEILFDDHLIAVNGAGVHGENDWQDIAEEVAEVINANL